MIILDGEGEHAKIDYFAGQTIRHPERALSNCSSISQLPDYDASEEQHQGFKHSKKTSRFDSKLWRSTLYALGIYIVLSIAIGVPLIVLKFKSSREYSWSLVPTASLWAVDNVNPPIPYNLMRTGVAAGEDFTCNEWDEGEHTSSALLLLSTSNFSLPAHGLITVRSNVSYDANDSNGINGSLVVDINKNSDINDVIFNIDMFSSSRHLREQSNVCFSNSGPNRGLSIYVPSNLTQPDRLVFVIQVLLPQTSNSMDSLAVYLPMFSQSYGDIQRQVWLNQISIEGTSQLISCQSLGASQISVKNILAPIQGQFNVTASLSLDTIKGSIDANITLVQPPSCQWPTYLSLDTGYSPINAAVSLVASPSSSQNSPTPSFVARVRTFNGPVNLNISHGVVTPPSSVQLQVQNNLADSNIGVDSKFQGSFSLQTKLAQIAVLDAADSPSDDPTGGNRTRDVIYDQAIADKTSGWVGWGRRPTNLQRATPEGYIEIISSLSPITLDLDVLR